MVQHQLIIHTEPPRCYYRGPRPDSPDLALPRLAAIGEIRSQLRTAGGETPNTSAVLDNSDGTLTPVFTDAPLLAEVVYTRDGVELFRGRLSRIRLGLQIQLDMDA